MNHKLFRLIMLALTVLLTLAITAPALATPPVHDRQDYVVDYLLVDCGEIGEIWVHQEGTATTRYVYDKNGELVEVFGHYVDKFHIFNQDHPELFINGTTGESYHTNKINGTWVTGSEHNFHMPGYPQLIHVSGYWYWEGEDFYFVHGRFVPLSQDTCELLTPP